MQWFRVDLKTFLGLAMPNQYSQTEHNREIFGVLPKSIIGNFKSIMGSGLILIGLAPGNLTFQC